MLAEINPVVLPAPRIAATSFLPVNVIGGVYIFRNRHRFFDQDPNISEDIEPVRITSHDDLVAFLETRKRPLRPQDQANKTASSATSATSAKE